jgi:hypothetical protein
MAELGHEVLGVDTDEAKISGLAEGKAPFFEPGLNDILVGNMRAGQDPFPGIVGFGQTVLPHLERALIAGHDIILLGERGQGKTRSNGRRWGSEHGHRRAFPRDFRGGTSRPAYRQEAQHPTASRTPPLPGCDAAIEAGHQMPPAPIVRGCEQLFGKPGSSPGSRSLFR